MALDPTDDPVQAIAELASSRAPWLFGVRHHSPACSIALPPLLDALAPTVIALELPADLGHWIEWLGHPEAEAPLAVAGVTEHGEDLGFYPFADFSPELVAIRWARANNVPVVAIDLPMGRRGGRDRGGAGIGIGERLRGAEDDSWEHLVEAPGTLGDPERVRRAALLYGWALRLDAVRGKASASSTARARRSCATSCAGSVPTARQPSRRPRQRHHRRPARRRGARRKRRSCCAGSREQRPRPRRRRASPR
ncbi:MAG: DUF5682 family protein [Kofleriaceae bacterium]